MALLKSPTGRKIDDEGHDCCVELHLNGYHLGCQRSTGTVQVRCWVLYDGSSGKALHFFTIDESGDEGRD